MPTRTCVVCRGKDEKQNLLRLVLKGERGSAADQCVVNATDGSEMRLCLDAEQKLPGRGVYCHARAECFAQPKLGLLAATALKRGSHRGTSADVRFNQGCAKGTVEPAQLLDTARIALADKSKGRKERLSVRAALVLEKLEALYQALAQTSSKAQNVRKKVGIRI
jgi:predicted RNA-binding protein YlxR (DUF448 family)